MPHAELTTLRDLRAHADQLLFQERYLEALSAYTASLRLEPRDLDVRLRIADGLLALGQPQPAAVVYTALARHAAQAGYPLLALVALKQLARLDPQLGVLLQSLADLYAQGSSRIGRGARMAPPDRDQALPQGFVLEPPLEPAAQVEQAQRLGADLGALGNAYPERLSPIPLFSDLPAKDFAAMLGAMDLVRVQPGGAIVREGEPGDAFFVLARGVVRVTKGAEGGEVELATLHEGAIFGEMALFGGEPRSATVRAVGDADVLRFGSQALHAAAQGVQTIATALSRFSQQRLINTLLATAPLFRPLDAKQRRDLMRRFTAYDVDAATPIIRQGAPGEGLFIVLKGEVVVCRDDGQGERELAMLRAGDLFGEMSLLNEEPATATVKAGSETTLLFLARDVFQRLLEAVPAVRDYVEDLGDQRTMDTRLLMDARPSLSAVEQGLEIDVDLDF